MVFVTFVKVVIQQIGRLRFFKNKNRMYIFYSIELQIIDRVVQPQIRIQTYTEIEKIKDVLEQRFTL